MTFRVLRWRLQINQDNPVWDHVSSGYLRYQKPSKYTLTLTPFRVSTGRGNDAKSETFRWVYDGREFRITNGTHIKRRVNPPISAVFFDYLPLEWLFCLDPVELNRRYYVYLFTGRAQQDTFYVINATPTASAFPIGLLHNIESICGCHDTVTPVRALLQRHGACDIRIQKTRGFRQQQD